MKYFIISKLFMKRNYEEMINFILCFILLKDIQKGYVWFLENLRKM